MGAFKNLNRSDVYLSDNIARKHWNIPYSEFEKEGIEIRYAVSGSGPFYPETSPILPLGSYKSFEELETILVGSSSIGTGSLVENRKGEVFEVYSKAPAIGTEGIVYICPVPSKEPVNLVEYGWAAFTLGTGVISSPVPKYYYPEILYSGLIQNFYSGSLTDMLSRDPFTTGSSFSGSYTNVEPQTTITVSGSREIRSKYGIVSIPRSCFGSYIPEGSIRWKFVDSGSIVKNIVDREGILLLENGQKESLTVGDVIYDKGLLILYGSGLNLVVVSPSSSVLEFDSTVPVYTYNVDCKVRDLEFNYSYNPTRESIDTPPYVTTVGLYNNACELLAVAKLSKPVRKADNVDTTFRIQLDIS